MRIKSKTIQITYSGNGIVKYFEWVILRGPGVQTSKDSITYYNDAQLVLCIF